MEDSKVVEVVEEEIVEIRKRKIVVVCDEPETEKRSLLAKAIGFLIGFGG